MRSSFALFLALIIHAATPAVPHKIPLHTERASPGDLEIGGELAGIPHGATRYLRYDDLLQLPHQTITVVDDDFRTPTQIGGIALSDLAKMLGEHADMIVAIC